MTSLPLCDPEVFKNGTQVGLIGDVPYAEVEKFIVELREDLRQPLDWHSASGRCVVLTIGPTDLVIKALTEEYGRKFATMEQLR